MLWYLFIFPIPLSRCLPYIPALIYHTQAHTLKDIEKNLQWWTPSRALAVNLWEADLFRHITDHISGVSHKFWQCDNRWCTYCTLTQCVFSQKKKKSRFECMFKKGAQQLGTVVSVLKLKDKHGSAVTNGKPIPKKTIIKTLQNIFCVWACTCVCMCVYS